MRRARGIDRNVLGCIVGGFEKGGTTLVKDLLRDTGRMQSAFEGGLLLAKRPAAGIPEPYATQLVQSWRLPADFLERYRRCASFDEGYRLLRDLSCRCHKARPLVDKTPKYMACLTDVLRRAPGTPVVIVLRDPLQVTGSWLRLGKTVANAAAAIRVSIRGLVSTPVELLSDVYVIQLADVVADPAGACARLQGWLGGVHVPYSAARHLGTGDPGKPPPLGVQADRIAIEGHWSTEEIAAIQADVRSRLPWSDLVAQVPSGPLADGLDGARPLWEAVASTERMPCPRARRPMLSLFGSRRRRRQAARPARGPSAATRPLDEGHGERITSDHAAIPHDVLGCIVTGYLKGGATHLKNLLVETTDMRVGFEAGLLLAERPAAGIPEPQGSSFLNRRGCDPGFLDRYTRCPNFEAAYRLVRAAVATPEDRSAPLLDKTPQYLVELADVMRRAPGTPVVVVVRDPLHVLASWLQLGSGLGDSLAAIRVATESLQAVVAQPRLAPSVYLVNYAELLRDADGTLAPLQVWLGRWPRGVGATGTGDLPAGSGGRPPLPRGVVAERHEATGDFPPQDLELLRRQLVRDVPAAADLAEIASGPAREITSRLLRAA